MTKEELKKIAGNNVHLHIKLEDMCTTLRTQGLTEKEALQMLTPQYEIGAEALETWNNDHPGPNGGHIMYTKGTIVDRDYNTTEMTWKYYIFLREKGLAWHSECNVSALYKMNQAK